MRFGFCIKLQFLFDLPSKLNEFIESNTSYSRAVVYYLKARKTLDHYKHMPTFKNIEDECLQIMAKLKRKLYEIIESPDSSTDNVLESINLLSQLGEPMGDLCSTYIERVQKGLDADLAVLMLDIDMLSIDSKRSEDEKIGHAAMDILEFVDHGCNNFLTHLSSIIQSYNSLFIIRYLYQFFIYSWRVCSFKFILCLDPTRIMAAIRTWPTRR